MKSYCRSGDLELRILCILLVPIFSATILATCVADALNISVRSRAAAIAIINRPIPVLARPVTTSASAVPFAATDGITIKVPAEESE